MIDGRVVTGYLRLASPGHRAVKDSQIEDLVARLRALVLPRLDAWARAVVDDVQAAPGALARVSRVIEETGRQDPAFAREVNRLCDAIARRGPQPLSAPAETAVPHVESIPRSPRSRRRLTLAGSTHPLEVSGSTPSAQQQVYAQTMIDLALSTYVQRGRLLFNPPEQMRQGRRERVKIAIAQRGGLDAQLRALAPGPDDVAIQDLETTPFMTVDLKGSAFSIVSLQAGDSAEQLLRPTALWQFDVTPERRGTHPLQLRVAMRVPLPDRDERVSLPVLERTIRVRVNAAYGGRRFVREHWQWVVATVAGLGGAVGAWIKLFQG